MPHQDEQEQKPDPSIVPSGPIEEEPSTTGLVADDEGAEVDDDSDGGGRDAALRTRIADFHSSPKGERFTSPSNPSGMDTVRSTVSCVACPDPAA